MNTWLKNLLHEQKPHVLPLMTSPGVSLIGARPVEVFKSGELQAGAIRALAERFPMAAAPTIMDLTVEAEAFGAPIRFKEYDNPDLIAPLARETGEVDDIIIPETGAARTAEYLLAAERCAVTITDRPTLGGMIGPFSLAGRIFDMNKLMLLTVKEPAVVHALLEKTTGFLIDYAKAFKSTGCGGLIVAEPAAGLISPKMCLEFSANYLKRIRDAVCDDSFAFILHNCGMMEKMVPELLSSGCSALHVGNAVDIVKILNQVPDDFPVMGNLDPSGVFLMGTPETVRLATEELLERTKTFGNFVISSGCDIPHGTPISNIVAFFETLERYVPA